MAHQPANPSAPAHVMLVIDGESHERLAGMIWLLCVGLMDEAVRVTVLSKGWRHPTADMIGPWRVIHVPVRRFSWRAMQAEDVLELLDDEPPDIVHCMSAELAEWMLPWCRQWHSRPLVHLTDWQDVDHYADLCRHEPLEAVAISTALQKRATDRARPSHGQIYMVPPGIPAEEEPACLADPQRVPAAIVTTPLTRDCGFHMVLRGLQALIKQGQEVQLFVLAGGPAEAHYRRQAVHMQLRHYITFAGRMSDWDAQREAMRGADLLIAPCGRHRFSMDTLAAMAAGLAVLAPAGTHEDYLQDNVTAALFDARQALGLATRWSALLGDRSTARKLAHGALDHVRAHYQASSMVAMMAQIYRQLCGLTASPSPA